MGLAVSVGVLADLLENDPEGAEWLDEGFVVANQLLQRAGLPSHSEPRTIELLPTRASIESFPYSFIHYLRRAYANRISNPEWIALPLAKDVDPTNDPHLNAEVEMLRSHLLCHSDAEGFYLPVDFTEVLFAHESNAELPGGMLGSSYRLLEELVAVAPALGVRLDSGQLSDTEAERIDELACSDEGLCREYCSWLSLYEAARLSIQFKTAIVFS